MSTRSRRVICIVSLFLILVNAGLCLSVYFDHKFISDLAWKIAPASLSEHQAVEQLTRYVQEHVEHRTLDEVRQMSFFQQWNYEHNIFRPGPRSVLEHGTHHIGPCQSFTRALRALLRARGFDCNTVVMHDADLRGIHSVLEVEYDGRRGIVSPTYGILYVDRENRPATLLELREDHELFMENARHGWQYGWGPHARQQKLGGPIDLYVFDRAYYFNYSWFGPLRWTVFRGLRSSFGEDALFWLTRPAWYSYPAYDYMICIDALALAAGGAFWIVRRRKRAGLNEAIDVPKLDDFAGTQPGGLSRKYTKTIPEAVHAGAQNLRA
jgi:hypothetical protein